MNVALFAFTERARSTALRIAGILASTGNIAGVFVPGKLAGEGCTAYDDALTSFVGEIFDRDALIFVSACGIAVRAIAPHAMSKRSDPAVLCVDERARFVIPILSGHIGGANRLATELADALEATAVITTATDINGRFSVDAWAAQQGLCITSMELAKRVSSEILTRDIPFWCDRFAPDEPLPGGLVRGEHGKLGVCVSVRDIRPFDDTLLLTPKALRLGIGCRRGVPAASIEAAIQRVLQENNLRVEGVCGVSSIDLKAREAGLGDCCRRYGWPLRFYSAAELAAVPGDFLKSDFVRDVVGVDNVCERAAAASGGRLIVRKTAVDGVTVAVAELDWRVQFV